MEIPSKVFWLDMYHGIVSGHPLTVLYGGEFPEFPFLTFGHMSDEDAREAAMLAFDPSTILQVTMPESAERRMRALLR